jgi:hypothetical protein
MQLELKSFVQPSADFSEFSDIGQGVLPGSPIVSVKRTFNTGDIKLQTIKLDG